jgi:hypothetical protein
VIANAEPAATSAAAATAATISLFDKEAPFVVISCRP